MEWYQALTNYFDLLIENYHAVICIKDFTGFIQSHSMMYQALSPYFEHTCSFCSYVKEDKRILKECHKRHVSLLLQCSTEKASFCSVCHAGVQEWIVPIMNENNVIGSLSFGCFLPKEKNIYENIHKLYENFPSLNFDILQATYDELNTPLEEKRRGEIMKSLEFIATIIAKQSNEFVEENNIATLSSQSKNDQMERFIHIVISYIKLHLNEKISVQELSHDCNYSPSFVSHNFKKCVGMNINTYINKLRIEISKNYLLQSDNTINEISEAVGFADVAYYSKVFHQLMNISPSEFRRRYKNENKIRL